MKGYLAVSLRSLFSMNAAMRSTPHLLCIQIIGGVSGGDAASAGVALSLLMNIAARNLNLRS